MAKAPTKTGKKKVFKKKEKKTVLNGIVYVQATFNNTIISITDTQGNLVCWSSAGSLGFSAEPHRFTRRGVDRGAPGRRAAPRRRHRGAVALADST